MMDISIPSIEGQPMGMHTGDPPQPAERAVEIVKEKMKKRAREESMPVSL